MLDMLPMVDDTVEYEEYRPLSKTDRCDRCTARALIRAHKAGAELLFCGHHGSKHFEALTDQGFMYQDDSSIILADEHD